VKQNGIDLLFYSDLDLDVTVRFVQLVYQSNSQQTGVLISPPPIVIMLLIYQLTTLVDFLDITDHLILCTGNLPQTILIMLLQEHLVFQVLMKSL
jgi:hypothetical protein